MLMVKADRPDAKVVHSHPTLQVMRALVGIAIPSGHLLHGYGLDVNPNQLTVDLFFFLEGFCATQIAAQDDTARGSILLRFLSIYPLYLIGLILGLISIAPLVPGGEEGWSLAILPGTILRALLFVPSFLGTANNAIFPINPPSWAIILEFFAFAGFCLLRWRLGIRGFLGIYAAAGLLMLALIFAEHDKNMGWQIALFWGGIPRAISGFFGGVVLYRLAQQNYFRLPRLHPLPIWIAAVACLLIQIPQFYFWLPALTIGLPLIILLGARSLEPRWLEGFGDVCGRDAHALYILGFPLQLILQEVTRSIGIADATMANVFGYIFAITVIVAVVHLIVRYIDEPIQRAINARLAR